MPLPVTPAARPCLAARARLRYDAVRNQHLLLVPERVIVLTETAAAILALCDGQRTVGEIVAELQQRYPGADVEADTLEFLQRVSDKGLVN